MKFIKHIKAGLHDHPGIACGILAPMLGVVAGMRRETHQIEGAIIGGGAIFVICWACIIGSAYSIGKEQKEK